MYLNSIKNDHADGCRSGCGLIRSILGILELSSEKNHTFITIWKSWFSYEFPLMTRHLSDNDSDSFERELYSLLR